MLLAHPGSATATWSVVKDKLFNPLTVDKVVRCDLGESFGRNARVPDPLGSRPCKFLVVIQSGRFVTTFIRSQLRMQTS